MQTPEILGSIIENHKTHGGISNWEAESTYLNTAVRQEMYGVVTFFAKQDQTRVVKLAIGSIGIAVYRVAERINMYSWASIRNIEFTKKQFTVNIKQPESPDSLPVHFELESANLCKV